MPLFRCFAAWLACSASVEGRSCPTTHTQSQSHSQSHVPTHTLRRRTGWRWGSLEMSRRARLDASLLACRASATRSLSKSGSFTNLLPKSHKLVVRFTRFSPTCPGLPYFGSPPPFYHYYLAYRDTASCSARNADYSTNLNSTTHDARASFPQHPEL